ncbi:MAG: hypothetical protein EBQ96_03455 [Proteobacteria bacterium]|nr:hypothetical protein [Pseudomonadota bacterium]
MSIVPNTVLDQYLRSYNDAERHELQETFYALRAEILNGMHPLPTTPNRRLILTAGAEGVGKSTYLRELVKTEAANGTNFALIDWDQIICKIPGFAQAQATLAEYFSNTADGTAHVREAGEHWIQGAKWIGDMLLNDFTAMGLPIAFETTAHNRNISKFLENFRDQHYHVEMHLGDAPMAVKIDSARAHHVQDKAALVDASTIERKSTDVMNNMWIFATLVDTLTVLWRPTAASKLVPIATSLGSKHEAKYMDEVAIRAFDAEHADRGGMKVMNLLGTHIHACALRLRDKGSHPVCTAA